jgi:tetratricopeptide (TPR) repeat protein
MKRLSFVAALCLVLSSTALVRAQDEASKVAARELADQGLVAYEAGRYDEAASALKRAYAIVKIPTLALYTARALEKLGKWVEASEIYLEATQLDASTGVAATQEQAKRDAASEREALLARIPRITIEVEGAEPEATRLLQDGVEIPAAAAIDIERPVNPGQHTFVGAAGGKSVRASVDVAAGERRTVTLDFRAPAVAPAAAPAPAPSGGNAKSDASPSDGSLQRTIGLGAMAVGGAGLIVGTVAGVISLTKRSSLDDEGCKDGVCYDDQKDDVESYNSMRTISTIGFAVGIVAGAGGAVLYVTAPKTSSPGVALWVAPSRVGVTGRF